MEINKTRAGLRAVPDIVADLRFLLGAGKGNRTPLSAWEVCGAARLSPADFRTCVDLDGLSVSDREYPCVLLPGTQRARRLLRPELAVVLDERHWAHVTVARTGCQGGLLCFVRPGDPARPVGPGVFGG
jgi:hypothetical protein